MFLNYENLQRMLSLDEIPKVVCSLTVMVARNENTCMATQALGSSASTAPVPRHRKSYIVTPMSAAVDKFS
jgi:hypothetical protein